MENTADTTPSETAKTPIKIDIRSAVKTLRENNDHFKDKFLLGMILGIAFSIIFMCVVIAGYYLTGNTISLEKNTAKNINAAHTSLTSVPTTTSTVAPQITTTVSPTSSVVTNEIKVPDYKGIPIKSNTLSIASTYNSIFVKIGKYIYSYDGNNTGSQTLRILLKKDAAIDVTNASAIDKQFKWIGIYDLSTKLFDKDGILNTQIQFNYNRKLDSMIFSFEELGDSFDYTKQEYTFIYYGKLSNYQAKLIKLSLGEILKSNTGFATTYNPEISDDGDYIKFLVYSCRQCDGDVYKSNILYKYSSNEISQLDKRVLDFKWLENGSYQYKDDFTKIKDNCLSVFQIGVGEVPFCKIKEDQMPIKTGHF